MQTEMQILLKSVQNYQVNRSNNLEQHASQMWELQVTQILAKNIVTWYYLLFPNDLFCLQDYYGHKYFSKKSKKK